MIHWAFAASLVATVISVSTGLFVLGALPRLRRAVRRSWTRHEVARATRARAVAIDAEDAEDPPTLAPEPQEPERRLYGPYQLPAFGEPYRLTYRPEEYEETPRCTGVACEGREIQPGELFYEIPITNGPEGQVAAACMRCATVKLEAGS
jgi:hypothetical protein